MQLFKAVSYISCCLRDSILAFGIFGLVDVNYLEYYYYSVRQFFSECKCITPT